MMLWNIYRKPRYYYKECINQLIWGINIYPVDKIYLNSKLQMKNLIYEKQELLTTMYSFFVSLKAGVGNSM